MRNPAFRLLTFVLAVVWAVRAEPRLLAALVAVTLVSFLLPVLTIAPAWRLIRRSRWLFLSIAVVYLWLTPGPPIIPYLGEGSPSWTGLWLGMHRVGVLMEVILLAAILLQTTARETLMAGIYVLARPLAWVGFDRERLAVRMVLVLEYVAAYDGLKRRSPEAAAASSYLERLQERFAGLYRDALARAAASEPTVIELPPPARPGLLDYLVLAVVVAAVVLV
jgi:hypothetical protein